MKCNLLAHEEKERRFPFLHIESVKLPDGCVLGSNREMHDTFRAHFRDRFARCPDLTVLEFRCYLANFPRFHDDEAASCEGLVTECKLPGLDDLPYEVYLRQLHMLVPILTNMFNHWFAQGAIPGHITKSVIPLLKKGGRYVWAELDDYRPITLLNTVKNFGPGLSKSVAACN